MVPQEASHFQQSQVVRVGIRVFGLRAAGFSCLTPSPARLTIPQGGLTAATKQQPGRPWGSLPKGCNKMRSYRSATAPGCRIMCMKRQQGHTVPPAWLASLAWRAGESLSLGLEQTVFQSPAAVPTSCVRFLQPLGRDPHGQTSSHVAEKLRTKTLIAFSKQGPPIHTNLRGIILHGKTKESPDRLP